MAAWMSYEQAVVAWADQQARLLSEGRFEQLDIEHTAETIEDVGKGEQRELANRMAALLSHLIEWQRQPERRGASREISLRNQRLGISPRLEETRSLKRLHVR
jgi:hypothetical protein